MNQWPENEAIIAAWERCLNSGGDDVLKTDCRDFGQHGSFKKRVMENGILVCSLKSQHAPPLPIEY
jgi:hypothetical protein